jgi:two-component system response regulator MtrA
MSLCARAFAELKGVTMSFRILVVDDKVNVRNDPISEAAVYLESVGYEVIKADNIDDAYHLLWECHPDLVLLDIHFPGKDGQRAGVKLCQAIRDNELTIPILLVSGVFKETEDILLGFDAGADNYITLPLDARVILAHVRANLPAAVLSVDDQILVALNERLAWRCADNQWRELKLQPLQFVLLEYLLINANQTLTRSMLKDRVFNKSVSDQALTVYVSKLNKKLGLNPSGNKYIRAVPDIGYRFDGEPINSSRQQLSYSCGHD